MLFGTVGEYTETLGGSTRLAVLPDGRFILGSSTPVDAATGFLLIRSLANGRRDPSFGKSGVVRTRIFPTTYIDAQMYDLFLQPDGKIVAIGEARDGCACGTPPIRAYLTVARYLADGSPDPAFGTGGIVTIPVDGQNLEGANGALDPAGRIVVADTGYNFRRLNSDGSLDQSFGTNGVATVAFGSPGSSQYGPADIAIQPDGRILAAGGARESTDDYADFTVLRLTADGALDGSFDSDGKIVLNILGVESATSLAIQPDGRILVFGNTGPGLGQGSNAALLRFNPDGSPDDSFGSGGRIVVAAASAVKIALQPDGKILAAVIDYQPESFSKFGLWRFLANGSFDAGFSDDGRTRFNRPFNYDLYIDTVAMQGDRILAAGSMTVVRFRSQTESLLDFDDDGRTDLGVFRPSTGDWWLASSRTGAIAATRFGASGDKPVPADYTGDGLVDLAVWRPGSGEWFVLRSEDGTYYSVPFGTAGDVPVANDYDGDGKTDPAVYRPSTATWYMLQSRVGTTRYQYGQPGDIPVVGDFEGDGKGDVTVFRPSTGQWWMALSRPGVRIATFGTAGDVPVAGDYTGDGIDDAALFRPATGEWFVLRSEDNASYFSFPFGTAGDVPAPGDYDGDGKTDAAVFRPSTATWYANRTTAGLGIYYFGTPSDIPLAGVSLP
ncbi:MAG: hypothetical protein JSS81_08545 [Acidobacteria bacterium]|nr:hypothetical protein [Acidobacteriota bacterium]